MTTWTTVESDTVVFGSPPNSLRVGYSVDLNLFGTPAAIQNVHGTTLWGYNDYQFSDDTFSGSLYFIKSRANSVGAHATVGDGDQLGNIVFGGDDGVSYNNASAVITAYADGTPGVGDVPGRLSFQLAPAGGASGAFALVEALSVNSDKTSDFAGTVNIAPAPGVSPGIAIVQVGPNTGTIGSTNFAYNTVVVANDQLAADSAQAKTSALGISLQSYGNDGGSKSALHVSMGHPIASNPTIAGDYIGADFEATSDANFGGTDTGSGAKGTLFGLGVVSQARSPSTNLFEVAGVEFDVAIESGATSKYRLGVSTVGGGAVQGAGFDAAYEIGSSSTSGAWQFGFLLAEFHGFKPISTTGTVIGTDSSSHTVANFADFHTYTFTGDILYFPNFRVTGAGDLSANSLLTATVTVANLPAASSGNKGMRMMVSNATATTFWSIVAGSGANIVPVTSDGTNWRIG